ncbi:substrate-binding domain-containing protein [Paraburkholderia phenoliruptrix]|uniref:substrate-binding domain-containing protein n=1 Tax=Paraburkholderia phenoliruptrix TaxID=252970 RepID=UPI002869B951|nr:substrate-binding domain-containing protein [Paraburkholderia phenoliruptrix]WMY11780.1 substrate-binding domain-containing protein [Paraburkholderia phenoliruptrix]
MQKTWLVVAATMVASSVAFGQSAKVDPASIQSEIQRIEKNPAPGPNGEAPVLASSITLTDQDLQKIRGMKAKAAIVMHYTASDWAKAQMKGQRDAFEKMGVQIIAVTDAGYKAERQVADIETVLAKKPDIIITAPAEETATADAYRRAARQGVKIVFIDQTAKGLVAGKDYVSLVSSDNRGMGEISALLMASALQGKGEIGLIPHASDIFATRERLVGFKKAIAAFPGIKVVATQGVGGPDFTGEAERAASAMLTEHPRMNGIWAVWDVPAEGVLSAARSSGRDNDLTVTTCDLGANIAIDMAQNGFVKGTGSQRPYGAGYVEGQLAGYALLGKAAPPYVVLPALAVTKANIAPAWKAANGTEPPSNVVASLK